MSFAILLPTKMHLSPFITFPALNKLIISSFPLRVFLNFISCLKFSYFVGQQIWAYLIPLHSNILTKKVFSYSGSICFNKFWY